MFDPQLVRFWGTMYMCLSHKSGADAVGEERKPRKYIATGNKSVG